jgi:hypothetical protein
MFLFSGTFLPSLEVPLGASRQWKPLTSQFTLNLEGSGEQRLQPLRKRRPAAEGLQPWRLLKAASPTLL